MKTQGPDDALARGLRAVAADDEQLGTSNAVGMRLMAEVQAIAHARRRRRMVWSLAAAAAVILAVLAMPGPRRLVGELGGTRPAPQQDDLAGTRLATELRGTRPTEITRELVTEFFPLAYSNVPARGGYVVRIQVPRSAVASFVGAATVDAQNGGSGNVLADVVVGDDGLARAVRFVRVISNDRQEQTP
jgi:hypothetical protein